MERSSSPIIRRSQPSVAVLAGDSQTCQPPSGGVAAAWALGPAWVPVIETRGFYGLKMA